MPQLLQDGTAMRLDTGVLAAPPWERYLAEFVRGAVLGAGAAGLAITITAADSRAASSTMRNAAKLVPSDVGQQIECQVSQVMAHQSLSDLCKLEHDWDGYGAAPMNPRVIASASKFIGDFGRLFQGAPRLVPMTRGRLQLEWHCGNRSLEIEFEDAHTLHYLKWDSDQGIAEEDVIDRADDHSIAGLLEWFSSEKRNADPAGRRTTSL
jgi:hypothetical protein